MYIDIIAVNITFIRCCHETKLSKSDAVANYYVIIILISIYLNVSTATIHTGQYKWLIIVL